MENQKVTTGKFALNYGLILAVISIAFSLMLFFLDMHYQRGIPETVINFVIMIGVIIVGIVAFKKSNEGFVSLSEALKIGIGTAMMAAVVGFVYYL